MNLTLAILMGLISRWHGGGFFKAPKLIKNLAWGFPLGGYVWFQLSSPLGFGWAVASALMVTLLCSLGKATGHGGGMDIGHSRKEPGQGRTLERLEFLIYWAHSHLPRWLYDAVLMSMTGLAAVLAAVLAITWINPQQAIFLVFAGLAKGPAYVLGWMIFPKGQGKGPKDLDEPSEIGEFLTGAIVGAALI